MSENLDLTWQQENRAKWPSWKQALLMAFGIQVAGLVLAFLLVMMWMITAGRTPSEMMMVLIISVILLGGLWIWKNGFWVLAVMGWNVLFNIMLTIGAAVFF